MIRYHGWWPGSNDPYYTYNITENRARINYYGADYAPHLWIDGNVDGGSGYNSYGSRIINEADNWSPLMIGIRGTYDLEDLAGEITVTVHAEMDPGLTNLKLRVALIENYIRWGAPNGGQVHSQTFRDMVPSTAGISISLNEGDTIEETISFTTPSPINPDNCQLVVFVQSDNNKRILQGAKINIPELVPLGVDDDVVAPETFTLSQNYPNPFNASTMIDFNTSGGNVTLEVFDLTGALVKTLVDREFEAGTHSINWDGSGDNGKVIASGVYFYKISTTEGNQVRRMTLLK